MSSESSRSKSKGISRSTENHSMDTNRVSQSRAGFLLVENTKNISGSKSLTWWPKCFFVFFWLRTLKSVFKIMKKLFINSLEISNSRVAMKWSKYRRRTSRTVSMMCWTTPPITLSSNEGISMYLEIVILTRMNRFLSGKSLGVGWFWTLRLTNSQMLATSVWIMALSWK